LRYASQKNRKKICLEILPHLRRKVETKACSSRGGDKAKGNFFADKGDSIGGGQGSSSLHGVTRRMKRTAPRRGGFQKFKKGISIHRGNGRNSQKQMERSGQKNMGGNAGRSS